MPRPPQPAVQAIPALPWEVGNGGTIKLDNPLTMADALAGALKFTGRVGLDGEFVDCTLVLDGNDVCVQIDGDTLWTIPSWQGETQTLQITSIDPQGITGIYIWEIERIPLIPQSVTPTPSLPWTDTGTVELRFANPVTDAYMQQVIFSNQYGDLQISVGSSVTWSQNGTQVLSMSHFDGETNVVQLSKDSNVQINQITLP